MNTKDIEQLKEIWPSDEMVLDYVTENFLSEDVLWFNDWLKEKLGILS